MAQQQAVLDNYEITADMAAHATKIIFIDVEAKKLTSEARRVCERLGINVDDLIEKSADQIRYEARFDTAPITDDIVNMRLIHFELRRRRKVKIVHDTVK